MAVGDRRYGMPLHQFEETSARLRLYRPIPGIVFAGAVEKQRAVEKAGGAPAVRTLDNGVQQYRT